MDGEELRKAFELHTALLRNELLSEFGDIKLDIQKQKYEVSEGLARIDSELKASKADIAEAAIDKTLGILTHVKGWVAATGVAVGLLVAFAGFFGFKSLRDDLAGYYRSGK